MVDKIRPVAEMYTSYGDDGRASPVDYVRYRCPGCNKRLREGDIACDVCGLFFDWSKKAKVTTVKKLAWE